MKSMGFHLKPKEKQCNIFGENHILWRDNVDPKTQTKAGKWAVWPQDHIEWKEHGYNRATNGGQHVALPYTFCFPLESQNQRNHIIALWSIWTFSVTVWFFWYMAEKPLNLLCRHGVITKVPYLFYHGRRNSLEQRNLKPPGWSCWDTVFF